jgi:hypothetical protein
MSAHSYQPQASHTMWVHWAADSIPRIGKRVDCGALGIATVIESKDVCAGHRFEAYDRLQFEKSPSVTHVPIYVDGSTGLYPERVELPEWGDESKKKSLVLEGYALISL